MSTVNGLDCARCQRSFSADMRTRICPCGGPLFVRYDLHRIAASASPKAWADRPPGMWRYRELLPLVESVEPVTLGEGASPLLALRELGRRLGLEALFTKDEGLQPTLTFKARGASLGVSVAKALGYRDVGLSTTGSAGTAWAAYCARAQLTLHLAVPADTPREVRDEAERFGAHVQPVPGTIVEAGVAIQEEISRYGWYDADAFREPCRLEGKKTLAFELAEALGWTLPDVVLFPTGGGIGPLGLAKGCRELMSLGWVPPRHPRLVLAQAAGCAPLVQAFQQGAQQAPPWRHPNTIAKGIRVPETSADFLLLEMVALTSGSAVAVPDSAILEVQQTLHQLEGLSVGLEGAAAFAALRPLADDGWLRPSDVIVVVNTGSGLKPGAAGASDTSSPHALDREAPDPDRKETHPHAT